MKKLALLCIIALLSSSFVSAQSKAKDRDVLGEWKLHVDLQKEIQDKDSDLKLFRKSLSRCRIWYCDHRDEPCGHSF